MKKSLPVLLWLINSVCFAQDSLPNNKRRWYVPDGGVAEFAGGFGMASVGVLYHWSKNSEVGLTVGYIPPSNGNIWTGNLLLSYTLLPLKINKRFDLNLFKTGVFLNYNYGKNIYLQWPSYYPENYYWWNSSFRYGPFIDTEIKYKPGKGTYSYSLFLQCLTNDLYLYTYFPNTRFIGISDIIYLGAGIRVNRFSR